MNREQILEEIDRLNGLIESYGYIVVHKEIGAIKGISVPNPEDSWLLVTRWDCEFAEDVRVSDIETGAFSVYKKQE